MDLIAGQHLTFLAIKQTIGKFYNASAALAACCRQDCAASAVGVFYEHVKLKGLEFRPERRLVCNVFSPLKYQTPCDSSRHRLAK